MTEDYEKVNKPALIKLCEERGLDHENQTAKELRTALRYFDKREIFDCDSCHYLLENVVLREHIPSRSGDMRGDVCRQFRCWLPARMKECDEYINVEVASDPNKAMTKDASRTNHNRDFSSH